MHKTKTIMTKSGTFARTLGWRCDTIELFNETVLCEIRWNQNIEYAKLHRKVKVSKSKGAFAKSDEAWKESIQGGFEKRTEGAQEMLCLNVNSHC